MSALQWGTELSSRVPCSNPAQVCRDPASVSFPIIAQCPELSRSAHLPVGGGDVLLAALPSRSANCPIEQRGREWDLAHFSWGEGGFMEKLQGWVL